MLNITTLSGNDIVDDKNMFELEKDIVNLNIRIVKSFYELDRACVGYENLRYIRQYADKAELTTNDKTILNLLLEDLRIPFDEADMAMETLGTFIQKSLIYVVRFIGKIINYIRDLLKKYLSWQHIKIRQLKKKIKVFSGQLDWDAIAQKKIKVYYGYKETQWFLQNEFSVPESIFLSKTLFVPEAKREQSETWSKLQHATNIIKNFFTKFGIVQTNNRGVSMFEPIAKRYQTVEQFGWTKQSDVVDACTGLISHAEDWIKSPYYSAVWELLTDSLLNENKLKEKMTRGEILNTDSELAMAQMEKYWAAVQYFFINARVRVMTDIENSVLAIPVK